MTETTLPTRERHVAPSVSQPNANAGNPSVAYCVDAQEAIALIDEMRSDAGDGLLAVDIETAPRRLTKARAVPGEIAALRGKLKLIEARTEYAKSAALDPRRGRVRLAQLYGGGSRVAVIDVFRTAKTCSAASMGPASSCTTPRSIFRSWRRSASSSARSTTPCRRPGSRLASTP
jgi:hypothetical protein